MTALLDRPPARPSVPTHTALQTITGQWRVALRLARRDAWRAKGRSLLVLLIVGLPVAVVTFAVVAGTAANAADKPLGQLLGSLPPQADARVWLASPGVVQSNAGDQSDGCTSTEARLDEVQSAFPAGSRFIAFGASTGTLILTAGPWAVPSGFAVEDVTEPLLADRWGLSAGRLPSAAGEIALSRTEAAKLRVGVGDRIQVGGTGPRKDEEVGLDVVGLVTGSSNGYESVVLPTTALPSPETPFQAWYVESPEPITWQDVRAVNAVGGVVGSRAVAEDPPTFCGQYDFCLDDGPRPTDNPGGSGISTIDEEAARNAALVAVVSVLVVLQIALLAGPAFAVQLRRRQRELGLVGASGGDSRQLTRTVLASGLVLGVVAAALGVLLGWAAVWVIGHPGPTHAIGGPGYDVGLPPVPRVVPFVALIGVVAAVSAAIVPALAAGRGDVVEALKGRRPLPPIRSRRPLLGLLVGLVGLGVMAYAVSRLDSLVLIVGIVCAQLGVVLVMPWLVVQTARIGRHLPLGPRVAVRDSARHRMRTTAAACAIAAAAAAAVGATAWAGSLDYGSRNTDVAVVEGVTAITDYGLAYAQDGTSKPLDSIEQARSAVLAADPAARVTVVRPVAAPDFDPALGVGSLSCGLDPASPEPLVPPVPCQGRESYGFVPSAVVLVDPADVDLVLGPVAPVDDVRAALERGDAVVLEPNAVSGGRVRLWIYGPGDAEGRATTTGSFDVPAVEVLQGAVPAQVLVGPAFLESPAVHGKLAAAVGGAVLAAPSVADSPDRPGFEDRVLLELVRGEAQVSLYRSPVFTDDLLVFALITAAATLVMALLAGLMVTALALADGRADVATLAAVGAPPRVRRRMAASSAGYVTLLGCAVGAVSGLVAGRLLLPLAQPDATWRTPWLVLLLVVVAVPVVTAAVAWVTTRSRLVLTRRLDS